MGDEIETCILLYSDESDEISRSLLARGSEVGQNFIALSFRQLLSSVQIGSTWMWGGEAIHPRRAAVINRLTSFESLSSIDSWGSSYFEKQQVWTWLRTELERFRYATSVPSSQSLMGCFGATSAEQKLAGELVPTIRAVHPKEGSRADIAQVYESILRMGKLPIGAHEFVNCKGASPVFASQVGAKLTFSGLQLSEGDKGKIRSFMARMSELTRRRIFECCFLVNGEDIKYLISSSVPVVISRARNFTDVVVEGLRLDIFGL